MNTNISSREASISFRTICAAIGMFLFSELLSFRGRIGRLKFLAIELLILWPLLLAAIIAEVMKLPEQLEFLAYIFSALYWVAGTLGAAARRLHDMGRSGGFCFFINLLWPLLLLIPGQKQENRYGPPPARQPVWAIGLLFWPIIILFFSLKDYLNLLIKAW